ncbi:hypothetical protein BDN70DRAFT_976934 [Pholiota conissans]|uniref:Uncharacterized protein n=1 Tax=Pholiota conissans TaxID=109636 RepID=A0A9P5Z611_9AGAR|nr:hypothetical protein BDN70DRAFT_976934 [Pholiota conissans]
MNQALRNLADQVAVGFTQVNKNLNDIRTELKAIPRDVFSGSNGHSDSLKGRVDELLALAHNRRIAAFNRTQTLADYRLLEKTVAGHGLALATAAFGHVPILLSHLVAPSIVPAIGTVPSDFDRRYQSERTIIDLIIFYNENFGIIAGDSVEQCFNKFHSFMTIL